MSDNTLLLIRIAGGILLGISVSGAIIILIVGNRWQLKPLFKVAGSSQCLAQAAISLLFIFIGELNGNFINAVLMIAGSCTLFAFILAATQIYIDSLT